MATLTLKRKQPAPITIIKECLIGLVNGLDQYILFLENQNIEIESSFLKILKDDIIFVKDEIEKTGKIKSSQLINLENIYSLLNTQVRNYSITEKNKVELEAFKNCVKDFNKLISLIRNTLSNTVKKATDNIR